MQFACEKCGTRYAVPDEKVRGKRIRTKCRKCGSEILVEGPPGPPGPNRRSTTNVGNLGATQPGVRPSSMPPGRTEERWTVALSRTNRRRMTTVELVQGYASGAVGNDALIWKAGMEEWQSPFDIPALALALQARGFSRPAVVPTAQKEPRILGETPPPLASAEDWESENIATRVADSTLRFPGRPVRAGAGDKPETPEQAEPGADGAAAEKPPVSPPEPEKPEPSKADATVDVAKHWDEEDEEETVALGTAGQAGGAPPPPPKSIVDFDDEATEVIAPDRARELLAAEAAKEPSVPPPPPTTPTPSLPFEAEDTTQIIAEERAEALLAAPSVRPSDIPPPNPGSTEAAALPPTPTVPMVRPTPRATGAQGSTGPSRPPRQPPRPRPLAADAHTPLDAAGVPPVAEKPVIPTPKPAAGVPPLASLAPPKPSSAPPSAPAPGTPAPPERPAEPTIVVAETKRRPPEAALQTMPRQRPPTPPGPSLRMIQNEPTRVVRVVSKGPGLAFWVLLVFALGVAAAGGFVVSQMLRDRGAPTWLKKP